MTNEEAIKILANATYSEEWQGNEELATANLMAIEALGKQIPKKPIIEGRRTTFYYVCPICGTPISFGKRCSNNDCGQAIDWSDDNNE